MNIREALIKQPKLEKTEALRISDFAASSSSRFEKLMQCFLENNYRVAQRAAWCVSLAAQNNKELILPFIPVLVEQLDKGGVHDAVIRNSLRILQILEIPMEFLGNAINACFNWIENPAAAVAIKAFALTVLGNISERVPAIQNEIRLVIDYHIDNETAAFRSRAKQVLKQMGD